MKRSEVTNIFTDGACSGNPGIGGWASVIISCDDVKVCSGHEENTTNNRMEVIAVVEGLKAAKKLGLKNVRVFSDSAYVINSINQKWLFGWKASGWVKQDKTKVKNHDLWQKLYMIITSRSFDSLEFIKVRGHSGNHFNEKADSIAKSEVIKGRSQR